jgi:ABC-type phosphate transport system ATPase subunit
MFREINTVTFDPRILTMDEMISALKAVNTYLGTAEK